MCGKVIVILGTGEDGSVPTLSIHTILFKYFSSSVFPFLTFNYFVFKHLSDINCYETSFSPENSPKPLKIYYSTCKISLEILTPFK